MWFSDSLRMLPSGAYSFATYLDTESPDLRNTLKQSLVLLRKKLDRTVHNYFYS